MTIPIRSRYRSAGVLLVLLFTSVCATAQLLQPLPRTRTPTASATVESKTGDINGRVVTENGQPLANVTVYVRPGTGDGNPVTTTNANRDGVFKVSGLEKGSYLVEASMPGYIPKPRESGPPARSTPDMVTLVLLKGGVITGTVINSKTDPVVAIGIRVEMVVDEAGRKAPGIIYEGVTDDRGVYRVYGLPTGTYIVAADGTANYNPTGVNAFATDTPTYAPSSSRESADEISVRVGEETSVDIRYRGEPGSTISGVVRATHTGDRGYWVTLTSLKEGGPRWSTGFQEPSGEFAFEGIPDGDYHLEALAYWNERDRGLSESMVLNVRGGDIGGIELTAVALASITGTIVQKELKEPVPECTDKRLPQFWETSVTAWHRVVQNGTKKPQFVWRSRSPDPANAKGNLTFRD